MSPVPIAKMPRPSNGGAWYLHRDIRPHLHGQPIIHGRPGAKGQDQVGCRRYQIEWAEVSIFEAVILNFDIHGPFLRLKKKTFTVLFNYIIPDIFLAFVGPVS